MTPPTEYVFRRNAWILLKRIKENVHSFLHPQRTPLALAILTLAILGILAMSPISCILQSA
jgi:hypothetical protein